MSISRKTSDKTGAVILFAAICVGAAGLAGTASAKKYNVPTYLPSEQQAKVNRVMADVYAARGKLKATLNDLPDEGGQSTSTGNVFDHDCSELDIGNNTNGARPDEQIIVADEIINAGGTCQFRR